MGSRLERLRREVSPHAAEFNGSSQTGHFHCKDVCSSWLTGTTKHRASCSDVWLCRRLTLSMLALSKCAFWECRSQTTHNMMADSRQPAPPANGSPQHWARCRHSGSNSANLRPAVSVNPVLQQLPLSKLAQMPCFVRAHAEALCLILYP